MPEFVSRLERFDRVDSTQTVVRSWTPPDCFAEAEALHNKARLRTDNQQQQQPRYRRQSALRTVLAAARPNLEHGHCHCRRMIRMMQQ